MKKSICVIYDVDEKYANKLMNVMNKKKKIPFKTLVFTLEESLLEYLKENALDILIISEDALTDNIKKQRIENILVLREDMEVSNISEEGSERDISGIYKYQSSENIVREVMNYCAKPYIDLSTKAEIIGIYSPINNAYKTAFSLALANAYGEKSSVLYINLEEFSGLGEILAEGNKGNLSDAVYYYKISKESFLNQLEWVVSNAGKINYIPPIKCAEDVTYISTQEWIDVFTYIANFSAYDVIVLDISNAIKEQWKLMQICKRVLMPVKEDYISKKKINSFEAYLLEIGKEAICDSIEKINVPYDSSISLSSDFMERIEWSTLGSFAKEIAYG